MGNETDQPLLTRETMRLHHIEMWLKQGMDLDHASKLADMSLGKSRNINQPVFKSEITEGNESEAIVAPSDTSNK
ncbi:hypothetical protein BH10PAT1_BH10PAT1_2140 [soil metagenome]